MTIGNHRDICVIFGHLWVCNLSHDRCARCGKRREVEEES